MVFYPLVVGTASLVSMLVLLRCVCGEPISALNGRGGSMTLIVGLIRNPLLLVVWFGPVLWIGVAAFEEVARVFCMTRIMSVWPGTAGQWGAVAGSTALFGLMHYYRGPAGVISTGVMGLVYALFFVRRGRIWPLIVGHALYDASSIGMAVVMVARGMR